MVLWPKATVISHWQRSRGVCFPESDENCAVSGSGSDFAAQALTQPTAWQIHTNNPSLLLLAVH